MASKKKKVTIVTEKEKVTLAVTKQEEIESKIGELIHLEKY